MVEYSVEMGWEISEHQKISTTLSLTFSEKKKKTRTNAFEEWWTHEAKSEM